MEAKESLRQRIHSCLDKMGPYHIFLLCTYTTFTLTAGYSNTVAIFYTYTPDYYCGIQEDQLNIQWNECGSVQSADNCTFNPEEKYDSIVTDYQLLCSDRYLSALSSTMYFAGVTIGALIFGPLSDYIGRIRTVQICTTGHILIGILLHFNALTPTVAAFIGLRFIQGGFNQGMQTIAYTSLMELTPMKWRTLLCCIWEIFWSLGLIYVGVISMYVFEWRTLQLYLIIPTALGVLCTLILPESMHWQWTKNKLRKVIKSYSKIARRNGDEKFVEEEKLFQSDKDWKRIESDCTEVERKDSDGKVPSGLSMITVIVKNVILRKHIIVMGMFWFTVTMCYYAITFFLPNLAGDRHLNFIMGGGIECVAYVLIYLAMNRYGRPYVLGICTIVNGALFVTFGITLLIEMDTDAKDVSGIVLLLMAKGLSVGGFCGMYVFTGELFPTVCRGTTFGYCGFWSRVGSLIAPQIVSWTELVNPAFPMFLMGALLALSGGLLFLLPETLKITFRSCRPVFYGHVPRCLVYFYYGRMQYFFGCAIAIPLAIRSSCEVDNLSNNQQYLP